MTDEKTIQVCRLTIKELFAQTAGKLTIPPYQRPYLWGEAEVTRLMDDLVQYFGNKKDNTPMYYLGSLILHEEGEYWNIIDGQQRITTLAILWYVLCGEAPAIVYDSPTSIKRIKQNLAFLESYKDKGIDFSNIHVTLVITPSADDAYTFFETQNTGGVRLGGVDIIKAHHLRAISTEAQQNVYARTWESQKNVVRVVDLLLKARSWGFLHWQDVPDHRKLQEVKKAIIKEFSQKTQSEKQNIGFHQALTYRNAEGEAVQLPACRFDIRQPLSDGQNFIDYLQSFTTLYETLFGETRHPEIPALFYEFVKKIIKEEDGTSFLKELFEVALLCYVHRFGFVHLEKTSFWLFRLAYSLRLINKKAVRADSIPNFVWETGILDYILHSFTQEQVMAYLQGYGYVITLENAGVGANTVKRRFIDRTAEFFGFVNTNALDFDTQLKKGIQTKLKSTNGN